MRQIFKFKEVGDIDTKILDKINQSISEEDWYHDDFRTQMFYTIKNDTYNSIPIRHSKNYFLSSIENSVLYNKFYPLIEPILIKLKNYYEFKDYIAFFTRLKPGGILNYHSDSGEFLTTCHRIHVPIKTNELAMYFVEDEWTHWKKGIIYEFDNLRIHNARNDGDDDRIHLILNLYPTESFY